MREAQLLTHLAMPETALAVTIDGGEADDIHPKDKQSVGRRLALAALHNVDGQDIVYSGPIYREMRVSGDQIRLFFDFAEGGLVDVNGGTLEGCTVAGADGVFFAAAAVIEGDTVVATTPSVPAPRHARSETP